MRRESRWRLMWGVVQNFRRQTCEHKVPRWLPTKKNTWGLDTNVPTPITFLTPAFDLPTPAETSDPVAIDVHLWSPVPGYTTCWGQNLGSSASRAAGNTIMLAM
eukprot:1922381-Pyramimonas_sp.AAC.1